MFLVSLKDTCSFLDVFNVLLYFWLVSRCTLRVLIFSVSVAGAELQFAALSEMLWSSSCGPSSCCCVCAVAPGELLFSSEISVEHRRGGGVGGWGCGCFVGVGGCGCCCCSCMLLFFGLKSSSKFISSSISVFSAFSEFIISFFGMGWVGFSKIDSSDFFMLLFGCCELMSHLFESTSLNSETFIGLISSICV